MSTAIEELRRAISKAEDEENSDLFLLQLYFENKKDLSLFSFEEEKKIKKCLMRLMQDTAKHQELLREVADELKLKSSQGSALLDKLKHLSPIQKGAIPLIKADQKSSESQPDRFLQEISRAEEEEESDLFLLNLHLRNEIDLGFFSKTEEKKVKRLLAILIQDTVKHQDQLRQVQDEIKVKK